MVSPEYPVSDHSSDDSDVFGRQLGAAAEELLTPHISERLHDWYRLSAARLRVSLVNAICHDVIGRYSLWHDREFVGMTFEHNGTHHVIMEKGKQYGDIINFSREVKWATMTLHDASATQTSRYWARIITQYDWMLRKLNPDQNR
jgi:hypothetical protein